MATKYFAISGGANIERRISTRKLKLHRLIPFPLFESDFMLLPDNVDINVSNSSSISIEDFGHFFQSSSVSLGIKEEHGEQLNQKPTIIDNIVFPTNWLESNRIDVVVEEESCVDA